MTEDQIKQTWCSFGTMLMNNNSNSGIFGVANLDTNPDGTASVGNHKCLGSACNAMQKIQFYNVIDPTTKAGTMGVFCGRLPNKPMFP